MSIENPSPLRLTPLLSVPASSPRGRVKGLWNDSSEGMRAVIYLHMFRTSEFLVNPMAINALNFLSSARTLQLIYFSIKGRETGKNVGDSHTETPGFALVSNNRHFQSRYRYN